MILITRETAAVENSTVFWPLLDSLADLEPTSKTTEKEFYRGALEILRNDFLTDPVALSSFELGLSLHTAAPKIEAYHQFYRSSVLPSLGDVYDDGCAAWVHFDGRQFCNLEDFEGILTQGRTRQR